MLLVEPDQMAAQLRLEYVRDDEHRRRDLKAGKVLDWGQRPHIGHEILAVALVALERKDRPNPQHRIKHQPEPAERNGTIRSFGLRHGSVEATDGAIEIPDITQTGEHLPDATGFLILRVKAYPEKADLLVIEQVAVGLSDFQSCSARDIPGCPEKAHHNVASRDGVEGVIRVARRALPEPRRGIAGSRVTEDWLIPQSHRSGHVAYLRNANPDET